MKLIKPSYEIIDIKPRDRVIPDCVELGLEIAREELLNTAYRQIELAGRTCYKSTPKYVYFETIKSNGINIKAKIDPIFDGEKAIKSAEDRFNNGDKSIERYSTSAKDFADRMIASGHNAMLEFGTIYLHFPSDCDRSLYHRVENYKNNPYSQIRYAFDKNKHPIHGDTSYYITTNLRVLVENDWLEDLKYICEPNQYHEKRIHVKFTTDRGVSHELVRHRVFSFAQESTRYCNYSKGKFDGELSFIIPSWWVTEPQTIPTGHIEIMDAHTIETMGRHAPQLHLIDMLHSSEIHYLQLIRNGMKPQDARQVLPNALKTEINMCGFISDWKHFFELRDSSNAHPDMQALIAPLHKEFKDKGIL